MNLILKLKNQLHFFYLYIPTVKFLKTCNSFDLSSLCDLHFLNFWILPFLRLKPKIISWSIGMRASYNLNYDINRKKLFRFYFGQILNRCSANIFIINILLIFGRIVSILIKFSLALILLK